MVSFLLVNCNLVNCNNLLLQLRENCNRRVNNNSNNGENIK